MRLKKFALVQHLASGDWWTSLDKSSSGTGPMKGISSGHAELVAVIPSALPEPGANVPTLGSLSSGCIPTGQWAHPPGAQHKGCGIFLDYGAYASFAPTYQRGGARIGKSVLGETVMRLKVERRRRIQLTSLGTPTTVTANKDIDMTGDQPMNSMETADFDVLDGFLSPETIAKVKSVATSLDMEDAIAELLHRNEKAIMRLNELQRLRFSSENGAWNGVQEGSEEQEIGK